MTTNKKISKNTFKPASCETSVIGSRFKPILFSTPMVQAILEGRKTQTRRIIKKKYSNTDFAIKKDKYGERLIERQNDVPPPRLNEDGSTTHHLIAIAEVKPKYHIGNILWVRETSVFLNNQWIYKADNLSNMKLFSGWKPSIFMPKEACRIFLKVTDVRVERLNDISEEEAIKEGVWLDKKVFPNAYTIYGMPHWKTAIECFENLWNVINGNWEENPWVWVYTFERIERPHDFR